MSFDIRMAPIESGVISYPTANHELGASLMACTGFMAIEKQKIIPY
jgi:hypothetical protein